ncbi:MAG TPA: hypothetical protein VFP10_12395 [Candidatus Eisenbacteria bacterium]|nr:hypothetical protein [Candidatus Eisenbacteria bacterium]
MIEITTTPGTDPEAWTKDREPLFSIDGTEYTIPREVPGFITLQAMEVYRGGGDGAATPWIMERMLGADGYQALLKCPAVTKKNLAAINEVLRRKVFGDPEDATSEPGKR